MPPVAPSLCPAPALTAASDRAERDTADGLAAVEALLRDYPTDPRLHFLKGSLLAALQRVDEALAPFAAALIYDPGYAIARFQLGLLQLSSGDPAAAAATWAPLAALGPEEPLRLFADGLQRLAVDDFAGAEAQLRRGIAGNSQIPALNRDMQLVLDTMSAGPPSEEPPASSSAQLLLQLSGKGTRH
jgi:tetratricopeptide (TPR) repeat protein